MRRRRKTKYYWLPTYGTPNASSNPTLFSTAQQLSITVPNAGGEMVAGWTPIVVNDVPNDVSEENFPLNDIIGNEYIVKRIVGKCPVSLRYINASAGNVNISIIPPVVVACGFYVARADRVVNNFDPIDSSAVVELYNPLNSSLQREPWIWRRSWILGAGQTTENPVTQGLGTNVEMQLPPGGLIGGPASFPPNNYYGASVLDGPHIDAKTGRRVRQDENLFFGFAAHYYPFAAPPPVDLTTSVDFHLDVRVLGALRRAKNRSNF